MKQPHTGQTAPRLSPAEVSDALQGLFGPCVLCEHRCGAMRADGERGVCGLADEVVIYNRMLHVGEERELVPSYTLFMSGCSMLCSFCSEHEHLRPPFAKAPTSPGRLAGKVARHLGRLSARGVRPKNINVVGGEPSIALPFIASFAAALDEQVEARPPILLNTNGYMTPECLALATHLCEIVVMDYKFGRDACAESIGDVARYVEVIQRNLGLLEAARQGERPGEGGVEVLPVELWVRHLLMPGHLACCTAPSLGWLAGNAPSARVNVMPAFFPFSGGTNEPWPHLSEAERAEGERLLAEAGLPHPYFDGRRVSP